MSRLNPVARFSAIGVGMRGGGRASCTDMGTDMGVSNWSWGWIGMDSVGGASFGKTLALYC